MTIANDIIFLSLRNSGVNGVGQTPMADDVNDTFVVLNALIGQMNTERTVKANRVVLPLFPDLTTDVAFWSSHTHVLLTTLSVRLRQIYSLPAIEFDVKMAASAMDAFNAINLQQLAPLHPGVPETVQQVLFLALRMAGRITDAQSVADGSQDVNDAFSLLVMMLGQWQRKRWLIWSEQEVSLVSSGAYSYSIGLGGDFDTPRPDKIHAAWVRLNPGTFGSELAAMLPFPLGQQPSPHPVDLPLQIIESHEDWAKITIKDLSSIPAAVFYDSAFPMGTLHFWPVPVAAQYKMHLVLKSALPTFDNVTDPLSLPPEYLDAVVNNLAVRIIVASPGQQQVSPLLLAQARASLETIKLANSQIPLLGMPAALTGHRGGDVSSWAGRGLNQAWTTGGTSVLG